MTKKVLDDFYKELILVPGEMIVIAARPGMGKTTLALNLAMDAAKSTGRRAAIISLEQSREYLLNSFILPCETQIERERVLRGDLTDVERCLIDVASAEINGRLFIDDEPLRSVGDIEAQYRAIDNLGLVVIDYLQLLLDADDLQQSRMRQNHFISEISYRLKTMANAMHVPVICTSQLSRIVENRENKRPVLNDFRENALVQDADVIIGLYREGYYHGECANPNAAEAIVLKKRYGGTGTAFLDFVPEYAAFVYEGWRGIW